MNKYIGIVTLVVKLEAPDESDARDMLDEHFGIGEDIGVEITQSKVVGLELI